MNNLFLKYSLPELQKLLQDKSLCVKDLLDTVKQSIDTQEPFLHAWVCYDKMLPNLSISTPYWLFNNKPAYSAISGIPFGAKDIFNTYQFPTEMGSPLWKNFTPGNNARTIDSLLSRGGILIGKTVTAEFAVHALNATLNPHDTERTPGTSSSGAAVAVSTGMVPFCLATQTAGSIIRPASFCGVWGMKPSFGMIPRTGVLKTTDSLDTIGFISTHGESLRSILDTIRVKGPNYPFVNQYVDKRPKYPKKNGEPWRVAFIKTHTWKDTPLYAKEEILRFSKKLATCNNFIVEELEWPDNFTDTHQIHSTIYNKSLAYYFQQEKRSASQVTPIMNDMIDKGLLIPTDVYQKSLQKQASFIKNLDTYLSKYDFAISLATASSAPLRHVEEIPDPSLIWTLGHLPSIVAPCFRCPQNLPFGIQFISRKWHDYLLLQALENLLQTNILPKGSQQILQHQPYFNQKAKQQIDL